MLWDIVSMFSWQPLLSLLTCWLIYSVRLRSNSKNTAMQSPEIASIYGGSARNVINHASFFRQWYFASSGQSRNENFVDSAVASMRPTKALASVKFWRISPIIFILHKRSSDIFNASWYYKEFSNSVNILWKNYHIIDLKGLRTLTQIFFEQILIKTIGEVNGHPDYVACFWLLLFKFHLN